MHLLGASGTYRIETVRFDGEGNMLGEMAGVAGSVETFSPFPTFGIVRSAVSDTRVDCLPYGQSVFADAVDAVQSEAWRTTRSSMRWTSTTSTSTRWGM